MQATTKLNEAPSRTYQEELYTFERCPNSEAAAELYEVREFVSPILTEYLVTLIPGGSNTWRVLYRLERMVYRLVVLLVAALAVFRRSESCSNFRLKSTNTYRLSARTNDQSGDLPRWKLISIPRNSTLPYGKRRRLTAKYGAVHAVPYLGKQVQSHLKLGFAATART